ncbi:Ni/Fe-hydrogenase, b-type cytochrome subunit [Paraburkholderia caribensis]|uniref:Ni/Fe-hydrogenase, b-type cytochrome subunit n=2 Tax=Paraburkholderia TaxID=1822464 RepID=B2JX99_PARP8|nr:MULTISPECIES: Ni/Fe-hydrogenase, b-type cytochrome subunit [Paraburkholderia]ACC76257.1 Ni/Fe-hydrogenase, b-type cytochrome subunit [Paraburkholderia phymatum STM815]MCO4882063.1 Ni/Fe-hydrogenase, b-type cytochrome subunit [Paraburkholderia caribensis]PTB24291.1 Ni/Fe-hydrogenase, b-type cytochrome subunit [Paraburkholderia caribensis]
MKTYGFDGNAPSQLDSRRITSVYVYEVPVRLWHWLTVLSVIVLCTTGYFVGKPLPTLPGETDAHFLMGYIRFGHFCAGYVLAVGLVFRVCFTFFGNAFAREIFVVPVWDTQWWRELLYELRWHLFLARYPCKYVGHNPLGQIAMFGFFIVAILTSVSGFALYGEGLGNDSWASRLLGWTIAAHGGDSLSLHSWHRLGMWSIVLFVMIHVYAAIREDVMSKQSMISTMVSGFRMFKN